MSPILKKKTIFVYVSELIMTIQDSFKRFYINIIFFLTLLYHLHNI